LLFEPGEGWLYGFSIDWAGAVVERLGGCASLGEYFGKHIWGPLGLNRKDWTFSPEDNNFQENFRVEMQVRQPDGSMNGIENPPLPMPGPLYDGTDEYEGGGGGLYMKPTDYFKLLESLMLNDGVLLKKETRDMMFEPQLKDNKHLMAYIASMEALKVIDYLHRADHLLMIKPCSLLVAETLA
jgi:CubicO group peptidase (beta-lactamase class C family)